MRSLILCSGLLVAGCATRQTPTAQAVLDGTVRVSDVQLIECDQPRDGCVRVQCQIDNGRVVGVEGTLDIGVDVGTTRVTDGPQPMRLEPRDPEIHSEEYSLIGQSLAMCGTREDWPDLTVDATIRACGDDNIAHADCVTIDCDYTYTGLTEITFEAVTRLRLPRGKTYEVWDTATTTLTAESPTTTLDAKFIEPDSDRDHLDIDQWEQLNDSAAGDLYAIRPSCEWVETGIAQ